MYLCIIYMYIHIYINNNSTELLFMFGPVLMPSGYSVGNGTWGADIKYPYWNQMQIIGFLQEVKSVMNTDIPVNS